MRTELWGLRNTETQELVLTYWSSSQKHKALFSTREKAEDACKHNPQYEPFRIEAEPVKWIPVTERLPERDEKCLCRYTFGEKELMYFYQVLDYYATDPQPHFQHTLGDSKMRVTHWMPLPKLPEDGGAE